MKTLEVYFFAIITTFQLAPALETCGVAKFVQVSDESRNISKLHFPWAGTIFGVNKTRDEEKFICGSTILTILYVVSGTQR